MTDGSVKDFIISSSRFGKHLKENSISPIRLPLDNFGRYDRIDIVIGENYVVVAGKVIKEVLQERDIRITKRPIIMQMI